MRDRMHPPLMSAPSSIMPPIEQLVIRPHILPLLPTFHGMESENPYQHIKEFEDVCNTFREGGASIDLMRLKLFPFALKDKAKIWLNSLRPRSIRTWTDLQAEFLKKFFPTHRTNSLSLIKSIEASASWNVLQTSSNSLICAQGFSLSIPWKVGRSGTICGRITSYSIGGTIHDGALIQGGCTWSFMDRYALKIFCWSMLTILIFRYSFHDFHFQFQLCFMRCFNFHKSSSTVSYPIWHTQLVTTVTKTKKQKKTQENKTKKRLRLTKN